MKKILVTGAAGFIGFHLTKKLIKNNFLVIGIDNFNNYYNVKLKKDRIKVLKKTNSKFKFYKGDIRNINFLNKISSKYKFTYVIHLAAQAGVRYSLSNPHSYINNNIYGFLNLLEMCRKKNPKHFIYASSSSVYGLNTKLPFNETDTTDHPLSIYASSKKSNELMAHSYSYLFNIPTTGLRFFTVYGPWGRPDMSLFTFTKKISEGKKINVFNKGNHKRSFTYIDDIVEGIIKIINKPPKKNTKWKGPNKELDKSNFPYRILNIGGKKTVTLFKYINLIEKAVKRKAKKKLLPMQPGDIHTTSSNTNKLKTLAGFIPKTDLEFGIKKFVDWYKNYYKKS